MFTVGFVQFPRPDGSEYEPWSRAGSSATSRLVGIKLTKLPERSTDPSGGDVPVFLPVFEVDHPANLVHGAEYRRIEIRRLRHGGERRDGVEKHCVGLPGNALHEVYFPASFHRFGNEHGLFLGIDRE